MNTSTPGRHRAPGGHSLLGELKSIARESAQPALKSAAVVSAAGGLIVSLAGTANAEPAGPQAAPAAVGPVAATPQTGNALSAIGFVVAAPAKPAVAPAAKQAPKAAVIQDVVVEQAKAKAAAAKQAATDRATAAQRASRSVSRTSLTTSTATTKSSVNSTPQASSGSRSGHNWATAGQCTWGALNKWYQSEGYYPGGWTGNASGWASGAASAGYTVSGTPRVRSIVVLQPGVYGSSSAGHVGWVTAVNGSQVTIVEMNALAGAYNYNTRTLTDTSGMRYIYAP